MLQASMNTDSSLWEWLEQIKSDYRACPSNFHTGRVLDSPFGQMGVMVGEDHYDGGGDYITVGFCLPDDVYAEIEDGTYGQMQGFRIYLEEEV